MANIRIKPIDTTEKKKKKQEVRIVPIKDYSSQNTETQNNTQTGQLAPVKSKKVATTVSNATTNKYSGYTKEQLVEERRKILNRLNKASSGGKEENLLEAFINSALGKDKKNLDSKEYKKYKKQYDEINQYMQDYDVNNTKYSKGIAGHAEKATDVALGKAEQMTKNINNRVQSIANSTPDWVGAEKRKLTKKDFAPTYGERLKEKAYQNSKGVEKVGLSLLESTIGMIPQAMTAGGAGIVGKIAPIAVGLGNYGGMAYDEARANGYSDKKAKRYGLAVGTLEVGLESLLGGMSSIYGKSAMGNLSNKIMGNIIKNKPVRDLLSRSASEFTEEYLQEFLDPILKNTILGEKNGADFWNHNFKDASKQLAHQFFNKQNLEAGGMGALSAGLLETGDVIQKAKFSKVTGRDYDTGYTVNEQKVIDKTIEKRLAEKENVTSKEKINIEKEVKEDLENGKIPFNEVVNALGEDRITPQDTYLVESYKDEQNKGKRYEYKGNEEELSEYGRSTVESAKNLVNNTKASQEFVDTMIKLSEDRQVAYKFTNNEDLKARGLLLEGKQAPNGLYVSENNGKKEILVNMNSNKYLEAIIIHETTHNLESNKELYNALKEATENFAVAKGDYNRIVKEITKTYTDKDGYLLKNVDINSEVTARLLEDYLGNEEYISHLTNQKPNLVQKIIDTVKYLKKQFTAGSSEARRLNSLQYKMEQAYKNAYNKQSKLAPVRSDVRFDLSKNAFNDVSKVISQTRKEAEKDTTQFVKLKDNTIKSLVDYGVKDLPMLERIGHVRENILTKEQAEKLDFSTKNKHYHGLGVKTYLEIIDAMDNPIAVYQYTETGKYDKNNFIVVTPVEINGVKSIVPVEINQKGQYNSVEIDYNKIKSVYSKNTNDYISNLLKEDKIKEIFTGSNSQQTSLTTDNISQKTKTVNDTLSSNSNMQNDVKYSLTDNKIQGLEDYSKSEIKNIATDYIKTALLYSDVDADIKGIEIIGSRNRGTARSDSDLDIVVELDGKDLREDNLFNVLNDEEEPLEIGGIKVDINPIVSYRSGTLDEFMERSNKYDKEMLSKQTKYSLTDNQGKELSKEQQEYFKDSKARNDKGELEVVYHTTTNAVPQFNEFNPVGTEYYRFGDQVVNYYTNDKDMSGSYANQDYVMADTKAITSMNEVNSLLEEHNSNLNPDEKYDYNLEIVKDGNGYKLKVTSQPGASYSGVIEEFYPRKYKDKLDLFKRIKEDIKSYKTIRDENGRAISKNRKIQYEGYVNITNPYVVDAEERNWNQVISKSNDFIDELDERVPQDIKDNLTRLYQESANKSSDARDKYNGLHNVIDHIGFNATIDENIRKVNEVVKKVGYNEIEEVLNDTPMGIMGVRGWYNLAEALEGEGLIGNSTAKLIIDDFKLPDQVKSTLQKYYNEPIDVDHFYLDIGDFKKTFGNQKTTTLKEIYSKDIENYNEFDKYRMPTDYFIERMYDEDVDYLGNELNDLLETRAEIMGSDVVASEIAQAASVAFSKPAMIRLWGTSKTTNDVVKEVIASNKDGSTNYDGVIIKNVYDYGGKTDQERTANDLYVTFNSNQFKAIDNTTPTNDPDIRYSLSEDNNGRKLSKQQIEYFKDSKVRDDNGNLKVMYHGTPNDFTVFNTKKYGGANGTAEGFGIYLTDNIEVADDYLHDDKGNIMNLYANITKPATTNKLTVNKQDVIKVIKELTLKDAKEMVNDGDYDNVNAALKDTWISNYTYTYDKNIEQSYDDVANIILDNSENDYEVLQELMNGSGNNDYKNAESFYKTITDTLGFDGIQTKWDFNDSDLKQKNANIIIAFNSNQVKNIDNLNPTSNDDIRYSLSNTNEKLPYDRNKTRGEDIRYSEQIKNTIEPLRQEIQQLTQTINEIRTQPQQGNTIAEEKTNNDEVLTIRPDKKQYSINKRVQKAIENSSYKGIKEATAEADKYIKFTTQERRTFKDALSKYAGMTKEDFTNVNNYREIEAIVENFANREYNYVDTELKSMKNQVRNTKIKITDDLKNRITDYNDFRKSNFGKLKLGNEGQYIDDVWAELSGTHPEYFSENITNEEDMLYALSDFMNEDINLTEQFRLSDEDIETVRDKVFNTLSHNQLNESDITELQTELDKVVERKKRTVVQEHLLHEMGITRDDIQVGKDISSPAYQRTDPIRVNEKVFGWKTGQKINDATVNQVKHNEAERTRFLNKERDEVKALGIKPRSKESAAVQKYAEKEYINEKGEYSKYGDRELAKEFTSVLKQNKIKKAAAVLRAKYDTYIDSINDVLIDMGYDPIPKRDNYMKHFYELTDKLSEWGIPFNRNDMRAEDLPTDINGLTDQFKPGKNWFASAMERKGMATVYDAITGIDSYLEGASNLIYHTEDIQRYRTLSKFIREEYGQQHGMDNIENMSEEEVIQRVADIQDHKLSKYVAWLDEQANAIAGKKSAGDRWVERVFGRKVYTAANTLKQQVGSNMTGFNVRSAMTNFASAIQGASKTNKLSFVEGTVSTIRNIVHKDSLIDKSDFLTNRFGSNTLSKKAWQKAINAGQIFMTGTDWFTANQIWRSKYYENLHKGMTETEAIKKADDFASKIMGDRSKGQTAELFNSKTLGLLTQFQLEVNNQWSSLIHDNKIDIQSGEKSAATVVFQLGQLFGLSYMFNSFMKSVTGSKVMIDPIDLLKKIFGADDDDKDKTLEQRAYEALGSLVDDIPFASVFTGGRIPIGEAFTGVETLAKKWTNQKDKYGNEITWGNVKDDAIESAFYILLPTGYGQIKKGVKGMSMYSKKHPVAGSYTDSGNLRFEADTSGWGKTKAFLFGQYASKSAQDYINRDYSSVDKDKLKEMKKIGLSADEYTKLKTEITQATKTQDDKKNYKYYDENGKLYYYNKDKDIVYDSKYKKTSIDIGELDKAKRKELLEKFLKSKKGLTSKQKEYLLENTFKGGKK